MRTTKYNWNDDGSGHSYFLQFLNMRHGIYGDVCEYNDRPVHAQTENALFSDSLFGKKKEKTESFWLVYAVI